MLQKATLTVAHGIHNARRFTRKISEEVRVDHIGRYRRAGNALKSNEIPTLVEITANGDENYMDAALTGIDGRRDGVVDVDRRHPVGEDDEDSLRLRPVGVDEHLINSHPYAAGDVRLSAGVHR